LIQGKPRWLCAACAGAIGLLLCWTMPAHAHKVKVFAAAEDATITGYVYFPGGGRARNAPVKVFDTEGNKLGQTTTDDEGEFAFTPKFRCDHVFRYDVGDGHQAQWTVEAGELLLTLPAPPGSAAVTGEQPAASPPRPVDSQAAGPPLGVVEGADIERVVAEAVRAELAPLRAQVARCREEIEQYGAGVRAHDILGGIGYIMGLVGIVLYVTAKRKLRAGDKDDQP